MSDRPTQRQGNKFGQGVHDTYDDGSTPNPQRQVNEFSARRAQVQAEKVAANAMRRGTLGLRAQINAGDVSQAVREVSNQWKQEAERRFQQALVSTAPGEPQEFLRRKHQTMLRAVESAVSSGRLSHESRTLATNIASVTGAGTKDDALKQTILIRAVDAAIGQVLAEATKVPLQGRPTSAGSSGAYQPGATRQPMDSYRFPSNNKSLVDRAELSRDPVFLADTPNRRAGFTARPMQQGPGFDMTHVKAAHTNVDPDLVASVFQHRDPSQQLSYRFLDQLRAKASVDSDDMGSLLNYASTLESLASDSRIAPKDATEVRDEHRRIQGQIQRLAQKRTIAATKAAPGALQQLSAATSASSRILNDAASIASGTPVFVQAARHPQVGGAVRELGLVPTDNSKEAMSAALTRQRIYQQTMSRKLNQNDWSLAGLPRPEVAGYRPTYLYATSETTNAMRDGQKRGTDMTGPDYDHARVAAARRFVQQVNSEAGSGPKLPTSGPDFDRLVANFNTVAGYERKLFPLATEGRDEGIKSSRSGHESHQELLALMRSQSNTGIGLRTMNPTVIKKNVEHALAAQLNMMVDVFGQASTGSDAFGTRAYPNRQAVSRLYTQQRLNSSVDYGLMLHDNGDELVLGIDPNLNQMEARKHQEAAYRKHLAHQVSRAITDLENQTRAKKISVEEATRRTQSLQSGGRARLDAMMNGWDKRRSAVQNGEVNWEKVVAMAGGPRSTDVRDGGGLTEEIGSDESRLGEAGAYSAATSELMQITDNWSGFDPSEDVHGMKGSIMTPEQAREAERKLREESRSITRYNKVTFELEHLQGGGPATAFKRKQLETELQELELGLVSRLDANGNFDPRTLPSGQSGWQMGANYGRRAMRPMVSAHVSEGDVGSVFGDAKAHAELIEEAIQRERTTNMNQDQGALGLGVQMEAFRGARPPKSPGRHRLPKPGTENPVRSMNSVKLAGDRMEISGLSEMSIGDQFFTLRDNMRSVLADTGIGAGPHGNDYDLADRTMTSRFLSANGFTHAGPFNPIVAFLAQDIRGGRAPELRRTTAWKYYDELTGAKTLRDRMRRKAGVSDYSEGMDVDSFLSVMHEQARNVDDHTRDRWTSSERRLKGRDLERHRAQVFGELMGTYTDDLGIGSADIAHLIAGRMETDGLSVAAMLGTGEWSRATQGRGDPLFPQEDRAPQDRLVRNMPKMLERALFPQDYDTGVTSQAMGALSDLRRDYKLGDPRQHARSKQLLDTMGTLAQSPLADVVAQMTRFGPTKETTTHGAIQDYAEKIMHERQNYDIDIKALPYESEERKKLETERHTFNSLLDGTIVGRWMKAKQDHDVSWGLYNQSVASNRRPAYKILGQLGSALEGWTHDALGGGLPADPDMPALSSGLINDLGEHGDEIRRQLTKEAHEQETFGTMDLEKAAPALHGMLMGHFDVDTLQDLMNGGTLSGRGPPKPLVGRAMIGNVISAAMEAIGGNSRHYQVSGKQQGGTLAEIAIDNSLTKLNDARRSTSMDWVRRAMYQAVDPHTLDPAPVPHAGLDMITQSDPATGEILNQFPEYAEKDAQSWLSNVTRHASAYRNEGKRDKVSRHYFDLHEEYLGQAAPIPFGLQSVIGKPAMPGITGHGFRGIQTVTQAQDLEEALLELTGQYLDSADAAKAAMAENDAAHQYNTRLKQDAAAGITRDHDDNPIYGDTYMYHDRALKPMRPVPTIDFHRASLQRLVSVLNLDEAAAREAGHDDVVTAVQRGIDLPSALLAKIKKETVTVRTTPAVYGKAGYKRREPRSSQPYATEVGTYRDKGQYGQTDAIMSRELAQQLGLPTATDNQGKPILYGDGSVLTKHPEPSMFPHARTLDDIAKMVEELADPNSPGSLMAAMINNPALAEQDNRAKISGFGGSRVHRKLAENSAYSEKVTDFFTLAKTAHGAITVGRGTLFGNPFAIGMPYPGAEETKTITKGSAGALYSEWLRNPNDDKWKAFRAKIALSKNKGWIDGIENMGKWVQIRHAYKELEGQRVFCPGCKGKAGYCHLCGGSEVFSEWKQIDREIEAAGANERLDATAPFVGTALRDLGGGSLREHDAIAKAHEELNRLPGITTDSGVLSLTQAVKLSSEAMDILRGDFKKDRTSSVQVTKGAVRNAIFVNPRKYDRRKFRTHRVGDHDLVDYEAGARSDYDPGTETGLRFAAGGMAGIDQVALEGQLRAVKELEATSRMETTDTSLEASGYPGAKPGQMAAGFASALGLAVPALVAVGAAKLGFDPLHLGPMAHGAVDAFHSLRSALGGGFHLGGAGAAGAVAFGTKGGHGDWRKSPEFYAIRDQMAAGTIDYEDAVKQLQLLEVDANSRSSASRSGFVSTIQSDSGGKNDPYGIMALLGLQTNPVVGWKLGTTVGKRPPMAQNMGLGTFGPAFTAIKTIPTVAPSLAGTGYGVPVGVPPTPGVHPLVQTAIDRVSNSGQWPDAAEWKLIEQAMPGVGRHLVEQAGPTRYSYPEDPRETVSDTDRTMLEMYEHLMGEKLYQPSNRMALTKTVRTSMPLPAHPGGHTWDEHQAAFLTMGETPYSTPRVFTGSGGAGKGDVILGMVMQAMQNGTPIDELPMLLGFANVTTENLKKRLTAGDPLNGIPAMMTTSEYEEYERASGVTTIHSLAYKVADRLGIANVFGTTSGRGGDLGGFSLRDAQHAGFADAHGNFHGGLNWTARPRQASAARDIETFRESLHEIHQGDLHGGVTHAGAYIPMVLDNHGNRHVRRGIDNSLVNVGGSPVQNYRDQDRMTLALENSMAPEEKKLWEMTKQLGESGFDADEMMDIFHPKTGVMASEQHYLAASALKQMDAINQRGALVKGTGGDPELTRYYSSWDVVGKPLSAIRRAVAGGDTMVSQRLGFSNRSMVLDEAQDANLGQLMFLYGLTGDDAKLSMFGDMNQDLYKFRGGVRGLLGEAIKAAAQNNSYVHSDINYRHGSEKVDQINTLLKALKVARTDSHPGGGFGVSSSALMPTPDMRSGVGSKGGGDIPVLLSAFDTAMGPKTGGGQEHEYNFIAELINGITGNAVDPAYQGLVDEHRRGASGKSFGQFIVPTKTTEETAKIVAALNARGVKAMAQFSTEKIKQFTDISDWLAGEQHHDFSDTDAGNLNLAHAILANNKLQSELDPEFQLGLTNPAVATSSRYQKPGDEGLREALKDVQTYRHYMSLPYNLNEVDANEHVLVGTAHAVKGLQRDFSVVPSMTEGKYEIGKAKSFEAAREAAANFYVAISRGRQTWMTYAEPTVGDKKNMGGKQLAQEAPHEILRAYAEFERTGKMPNMYAMGAQGYSERALQQAIDMHGYSGATTYGSTGVVHATPTGLVDATGNPLRRMSGLERSLGGVLPQAKYKTSMRDMVKGLVKRGPAFAEGGPIRKDEDVMVGEKGREVLWDPGQNEFMIAHEPMIVSGKAGMHVLNEEQLRVAGKRAPRRRTFAHGSPLPADYLKDRGASAFIKFENSAAFKEYQEFAQFFGAVSEHIPNPGATTAGDNSVIARTDFKNQEHAGRALPYLQRHVLEPMGGKVQPLDLGSWQGHQLGKDLLGTTGASMGEMAGGLTGSEIRVTGDALKGLTKTIGAADGTLKNFDLRAAKLSESFGGDLSKKITTFMSGLDLTRRATPMIQHDVAMSQSRNPMDRISAADPNKLVTPLERQGMAGNGVNRAINTVDGTYVNPLSGNEENRMRSMGSSAAKGLANGVDWALGGGQHGGGFFNSLNGAVGQQFFTMQAVAGQLGKVANDAMDYGMQNETNKNLAMNTIGFTPGKQGAETDDQYHATWQGYFNAASGAYQNSPNKGKYEALGVDESTYFSSLQAGAAATGFTVDPELIKTLHDLDEHGMQNTQIYKDTQSKIQQQIDVAGGQLAEAGAWSKMQGMSPEEGIRLLSVTGNAAGVGFNEQLAPEHQGFMMKEAGIIQTLMNQSPAGPAEFLDAEKYSASVMLPRMSASQKDTGISDTEWSGMTKEQQQDALAEVKTGKYGEIIKDMLAGGQGGTIVGRTFMQMAESQYTPAPRQSFGFAVAQGTMDMNGNFVNADGSKFDMGTVKEGSFDAKGNYVGGNLPSSDPNIWAFQQQKEAGHYQLAQTKTAQTQLDIQMGYSQEAVGYTGVGAGSPGTQTVRDKGFSLGGETYHGSLAIQAESIDLKGDQIKFAMQTNGWQLPFMQASNAANAAQLGASEAAVSAGADLSRASLAESKTHLQAELAMQPLRQEQFETGQQVQSNDLARQQRQLMSSRWLEDVMYGSPGSDQSFKAYSSWQQSQLSAGQGAQNAGKVNELAPTNVMGLANQQAYRGLEYQKRMLVYGQSSLSGAAQYEEQMKYIKFQEEATEKQRSAEAKARKEQRSLQDEALADQKQMLTITQELERKNFAEQARQLNAQMGLLDLQGKKTEADIASSEASIAASKIQLAEAEKAYEIAKVQADLDAQGLKIQQDQNDLDAKMMPSLKQQQEDERKHYAEIIPLMEGANAALVIAINAYGQFVALGKDQNKTGIDAAGYQTWDQLQTSLADRYTQMDDDAKKTAVIVGTTGSYQTAPTVKTWLEGVAEQNANGYQLPGGGYGNFSDFAQGSAGVANDLVTGATENDVMSAANRAIVTKLDALLNVATDMSKRGSSTDTPMWVKVAQATGAVNKVTGQFGVYEPLVQQAGTGMFAGYMGLNAAKSLFGGPDATGLGGGAFRGAGGGANMIGGAAAIGGAVGGWLGGRYLADHTGTDEWIAKHSGGLLGEGGARRLMEGVGSVVGGAAGWGLTRKGLSNIFSGGGNSGIVDQSILHAPTGLAMTLAGAGVGYVAGGLADSALGHFGLSSGKGLFGQSGAKTVGTFTGTGAGIGMRLGGPEGALIGAGVGALAGLGVVGWQNRKAIGSAIEDHTPEVVKNLANASWIQIKRFWEWLKGLDWAGAGEIAKTTFNFLKGFFTDFHAQIHKVMKFVTSGDDIAKVIKGFFHAIAAPFDKIIDKLPGGQFLTDAIGKVFDTYVEIWSHVLAFIIKAETEIFSYLKDNWSDPLGMLDDAWNLIQTAFKDGYNWIKDNALDIPGMAWNVFSSIIDLIHLPDGWWGDLNLAGKAYEVLASIGSMIQGGIDWLASTASGAVLGAVKALANGVIGMVNGIIEWVNSKAGWIGVNIGTLSYLATGSSSTGAGMAMVGEQGPELMRLPDGSMHLATDKTLVNLPMGSKVYNAADTRELMRTINVTGSTDTSKMGSQSTGESRFQLTPQMDARMNQKSAPNLTVTIIAHPGSVVDKAMVRSTIAEAFDAFHKEMEK